MNDNPNINSVTVSLTIFLFQYELDDGETSLSALLLSVQRSLNRSSDADVIAFGTALTEKDMLCQVATLTSSSSFDLYDLTLYRSTPCSSITDAQHAEQKTSADYKRCTEYSTN